jgi:bifunctional ADP-heptose synthase (sugar kinase/adenylyltransferase)
MPSRNKNIFVIGDLVIDHTVYVSSEAEIRARQHTGVPIYQVVRRLDTAGGAANCARVLAVLNPGHTFLWGLIGKSHWGDFRSILEHCQLIDGAHSNIKFRGVSDETNAQMNTITRLIGTELVPSYDPPSPIVRFDDYGHVHISEEKRNTVLHYLERVHQKYNLDGIILNDLDMNCLKAEMIKKIADFASKGGIPLFVNPKHEKDKYKDIKGKAIVPNLSEWCHLIGQPERFAYWRDNLDRKESLQEMAELSFESLGNFDYHIIECGEKGCVLMAPHPEMFDRYAVYRAEPHQTQANHATSHFGCGDVLTAIFAMEFSEKGQTTTHEALAAFQKANAVLACYRDMPWPRMPTREVAAFEQGRTVEPKMAAQPSKGILFLPKERVIRLSDPKHQTKVPGLLSVDLAFRETVISFIEDIEKGLEVADKKSIILSAPSASGKSTIMRELGGKLGEHLGVKLIMLSKPKDFQWDDPEPFFEELLKQRGAKADKLLIGIDEAIKEPFKPYLVKYGVKLLETAHDMNVRFVFIDALFGPGNELPVDSEFTSRCVPYYLPGLLQRPLDIPYIVAGMIFAMGEEEGRNFDSLMFEGKFLLAVINAALQHPQLRELKTRVNDAYKAALREWDGKESLTMLFKHLPVGTGPLDQQPSDIAKGLYEFYQARY